MYYPNEKVCTNGVRNQGGFFLWIEPFSSIAGDGDRETEKLGTRDSA